MTALREQLQEQRAVYARARKLLGEEQQELDRLLGDHAGDSARWIAEGQPEALEAELREREDEIDAVKRRVTRFAAVAEASQPLSARLPAS
jgi:hypothetical protein